MNYYPLISFNEIIFFLPYRLLQFKPNDIDLYLINYLSIIYIKPKSLNFNLSHNIVLHKILRSHNITHHYSNIYFLKKTLIYICKVIIWASSITEIRT